MKKALQHLLIAFLFAASLPGWAQPPRDLELSRAVRAFEFLPVTGTHSGLLGHETGNFEAWVYPLKIFRNFHLNFLTEGRVLAADTLARTLTVRPESVTITYAGDTFSVRETLFCPLGQPGAVIVFEIETGQPLEIEAIFDRSFQLEWPAAVGGSYINWDAGLKAFYFGEEQKKYAAFVGSPSATDFTLEYFTNYSGTISNSMRLGVTGKPPASGSQTTFERVRDTRVIAIAGSMNGPAEAEKTYRHLANDWAGLLRDSAAYYRDYLAQTVNLELPDAQLQSAYDWARVSVLQGLVANPFLGAGLVAGYRTSGDYERPGFAWYFGRDSLWTDLALDAGGDFKTTRTALDFIAKFQRADGKIEHEIAQSASLVDWFNKFPYAYASADATPLYIITCLDYVTHSGDVAFVKEKWDSLWKAHEFLRSTYDTQGFPQNLGIGHGWIEGGPLLPVKYELYQVGLGAESLRALSGLAHLAGKEDVSRDLAQQFEKQKAALNQAFWAPDKNYFAYAIDKDGKRLDTPSVLVTAPMWFGVFDPAKANSTIAQLAGDDHQADWGMRILSSRDPRYNPGGYHFGSVWPLFTGWASVGEYRYHRALPAYYNLRANALMTFDGSLGHVTEVLSGDYYQQLSTSSPHQIWSAAMVVSPILRGMLGLEQNALTHTLTFAPHLPAGWTSVRVKNVHVGDAVLDLAYARTSDGVSLEVQRTGGPDSTIEFSPALSPRAQVLGAELNGKPVKAKVEAGDSDQHASLSFPVAQGTSTLRLRTRNDFGLGYASTMPALGSSSQGMRITSETWSPNRDTLTLAVSGIPGKQYSLDVWDASELTSIDGAKLLKDASGTAALLVTLAGTASQNAYVSGKVTLHFRSR